MKNADSSASFTINVEPVVIRDPANQYPNKEIIYPARTAPPRATMRPVDIPFTVRTAEELVVGSGVNQVAVHPTPAGQMKTAVKHLLPAA